MKISLILIALLLVAACSAPPTAPTTSAPATDSQSMTQSLESDLFAANEIVLPAPACDGTLTPEQTEGPYYTADTPERNSLFEPGMAGQRLLVVGYVLDTNCQPTSNAWLDFWQADASGQYDNQGYVLRGHQFTDSQGRYVLETVIPGEYPGRTQHIHVKLQRPGGQVVTSQLYFPGSGSNASDGIFDAALLVTLEERGDYTVAYYNFVLR